ncbi:hypothetical protein AOXY_G12911, partial [Acipenser oxyrinchus oxyrinchus]
KKKSVVSKAEMQWRIKSENMSTNGFRSLLGVRKASLPQYALNRPKKAKTKMSIFSFLTEGEATDLANGYGSMMARHVTAEAVCATM